MIKPRDYGVSLRELQTSLPWTVRYSRDFRANPQPHKDFAHAVVHVTKALGKLAAFVNEMDHDRGAHESASAPEISRYIADLVVCALRMANTMPGGVLDLERAVIDRINTKNTPSLVEVMAQARSRCRSPYEVIDGGMSSTHYCGLSPGHFGDHGPGASCSHLADSADPGRPGLSEQPCSRCGLYYADEARP